MDSYYPGFHCEPLLLQDIITQQRQVGGGPLTYGRLVNDMMMGWISVRATADARLVCILLPDC